MYVGIGIAIGLLVGLPLLLATGLAVSDDLARDYVDARRAGRGPWRALYRAYRTRLTGRH